MLPGAERFVRCRNVDAVIEAIRDLTVRGAPAIGVVAAWGCCLAAAEAGAKGVAWKGFLQDALERLSTSRPTAVNLHWAVNRMSRFWLDRPELSLDALLEGWLRLAEAVQEEDLAANKAIGRFGAALIDNGDTVMTHCNAGALATAGYGTALGVVRAALEEGKHIRVIANETRPVLQGARLTAYELHQDGIPVSVACDNAAGLLMQKGLVQKVVVGADRIAANGDTANKIGTYGVAVLAREHGIPFYLAAPLSSIDPDTLDGQAIPIEERDGEEVAVFAGQRILPQDVPVYNFAFDVTPARFIAGIITDQGVLFPPYERSIAVAFARLRQQHNPGKA
jgi:methylthioribose-1-phosphate isomerase